jgi:hypothetical protein
MGQLGHGDCDSRDVPDKILSLCTHVISDVYGGIDFCVFRTSKIVVMLF